MRDEATNVGGWKAAPPERRLSSRRTLPLARQASRASRLPYLASSNKPSGLSAQLKYRPPS